MYLTVVGKPFRMENILLEVQENMSSLLLLLLLLFLLLLLLLVVVAAAVVDTDVVDPATDALI
jgi:hypothetical protein